MRSFGLIIKIFFINLSLTKSESNFFQNEDYLSLILNIHRYFGTSCIFVLHNRQRNLKEFYRLTALLRDLSAVNVFASSIEFKRVNDTAQLHEKSVVRPLVVVALRNLDVFNQFKELARQTDMGGRPCWLLLFNDTVYSETYPPKPGDNTFSLTFNTEMVVVVSGDKNIREWYWLNDKLMVEAIAVWDFRKGFNRLTNKSLYQRRENLDGHVMVVTTVHNPPILTFANNTIGGICGAIILELATAANFQIKFVSPRVQSYGSWNNKLKKWSGMMEVLVQKNASIAVAEFTMSAMRIGAVDFTVPLITTRDKMFIRKPESGINWSSYWQTLAPGNWIVIQVLILTTTSLLTLINFVSRSRITADVISEYLLLVFGIYCQQGLPVFPTDSPSRIVYFSVLLSALVVLAAYSAALISFLTVTTVSLPFTTIEEFVKDGSYNLIVFRDGAEYDMFMTTTEPTLSKMRLLLNDPITLPRNLKEGFEQVCTKRVALYLPGALEEAYRILLPCKLVGIDAKRSMSLAMALSKGNSYNGLINYHIQKFRDHGLLDRLKRRYTVEPEPPTSTHNEVTAVGILPIIIILTTGIFLSVVILFVEKFFFKEFITSKNRSLKKNHDIKYENMKIRHKHRTIKYFTSQNNFYH